MLEPHRIEGRAALPCRPPLFARPRRSILHRVTVHGRGPRTVVFGNGFGTGQGVWRRQIEALEQSFRVVCFDYAGAPDCSAPYSAERYASLYAHADDLLAILNDLGLENVTFAGHATSGVIGLIAAVAAPQKIARLVMINASPRYARDEGYEGCISRAQIDSLLDAMVTDYHAWVSGFSFESAKYMRIPAEIAASFRLLPPAVAHHALTCILRADVRHLLPRVTQPTLVIQSEADRAVPVAMGRYLAAHIPGAVLRTVPVAGHYPHVSVPDLVTPLILELAEA